MIIHIIITIIIISRILAMMCSSLLSKNSLHFSGGFVFVHFFFKYQTVQLLEILNHYAHLA